MGPIVPLVIGLSGTVFALSTFYCFMPSFQYKKSLENEMVIGDTSTGLKIICGGTKFDVQKLIEKADEIETANALEAAKTLKTNEIQIEAAPKDRRRLPALEKLLIEIQSTH